MEFSLPSVKSKIIFTPKKAGWVIILVGLLLFVIISSYYFYNQYQRNQLLQNPSEAVNIQAQNLLDRVGSLIELPTNEQPKIATVNDKNQLPVNPFFAKAENGDKVLIYSQSKKAILYRPSINKIIEVSSIIFESNNLAPVASVSASPIFGPNVTAEPTLTPRLTPLATP